MKNLRLFFLSAAVVLSVLLVLAVPSLADGGNITNLTIHKTVLNPESNRYVDNMGLHDIMFHPGDPITFHITIGNTGNATILQVILKDVFPKYVTFINGSGTFDPISKTLTIITINLTPSTTQTFSITGRIMDANLLPDQKTTCDTNQATASSNAGQTVQAVSQFCMMNPNPSTSSGSLTTQPTQPATSQPNQNTQPIYPPASTSTTPATGAENAALVLPLISGLAGVLMRIKKIG